MLHHARQMLLLRCKLIAMVLPGLSVPTSACLGMGVCAAMSATLGRRRRASDALHGAIVTVAMCAVLEVLCALDLDFLAWALITPTLFMIPLSLIISTRELASHERRRCRSP